MPRFIQTYAAWVGAFVLGLAFAVAAQENAEPYALSTRVGPEIDRDEREYFNLFPEIPGFNSARTFLLPNGSVVLRINRQVNGFARDSTCMLLPELAGALQKFLEDFEAVYNSANLKNMLVISTGLARSSVGRTPMKLGAQLSITTAGGQQHLSRLLFVSDSALALWRSAQTYQWRQPLDSLQIFRYTEIRSIFIPHQSRFWSGAGYGLLIGGGAGVVIGLADGDDKKATFGPSFSAGEKALGLGIVFGVPSALIGGVIGGAQAADETLRIDGNHQYYKMFAPKLRRQATFQTLLPPELHNR